MGDTRIDEEKELKVYKTTAKHFKVFKGECERLVKLFGLMSFSITYAHIKDEDNRASAAYTSDYRVTITLATELEEYVPVTDESLKRLARHEIAHLLIAKIHIMAMQRCIVQTTFEDELEAYAHRMEDFLSNIENKKGGK